MYVLLPNEGIGINDFINSLSRDLLSSYISGGISTETILKFPKFNIEYGAKSLVGPLKNLGMADAFSTEKADFGSIAPRMYISQIEHKAIIEVNEEGTVAAAASSFGMGATAVRPVDFIVNRPFILLIRDDRTGNILFIGKILQP
jgi:serine protease inhibitor